MGKRLVGKVTIVADGNTLLTNLDCTYQLADEQGTAMMGDGGLNGITYKPVAGIVECTISSNDDVDLEVLKPSAAADINLLVQPDAGKPYAFPHASQINPIKVTAEGGGKIPLQFVSKTSSAVTT